ncbi:MAG: ATP-dependent DNA ligase [Ideonella sp.]|nr:ATP-dependent DNA ligase [Ideonella sp.]
MKAFASLFAELDASTSTAAKVAALSRYLVEADPADAGWAVYFLSGGKPRQVLPTATLRALACARAGLDDWLFEECYQAVGDLAETIAHVLPPGPSVSDLPLAVWVEDRLLGLRGQPPDEQAARVLQWWDELDVAGRFLLTKLIGGGFRVGVSRLLVQRAIAEAFGLDPKQVAQRMMGYTDARARPGAAAFRALVDPAAGSAAEGGQPYPFFLAHAVDHDDAIMAERLGAPADWCVEWKFDGIRAQLVRRCGRVWIWSRGEELVTDRFPEIVEQAARLPDGTVLDGEILVAEPGQAGIPGLGLAGWRPAPFQRLQTRIGRKHLTRKLLAEAPVRFLAYDLLEAAGVDQRDVPQHRRRAALEALLAGHTIEVSPLVRLPPVLHEGPAGVGPMQVWGAWRRLREQARSLGVEGFMLKHRDTAYGIGRRRADDRGGWLKWKIEPLTLDAVLVYAQAGHGRRASLYTDYTFAVWNRTPRDAAEADAALDAPARDADPAPLQLVPVAKAYSGLTDDEIVRVDRVIRQTTREKFGPVRSVRPTLVFELGFEGLQRSPRHKSGVALRFPRMLRMRPDKPLHEADTLPTLLAMLERTAPAASGAEVAAEHLAAAPYHRGFEFPDDERCRHEPCPAAPAPHAPLHPRLRAAREAPLAEPPARR